MNLRQIEVFRAVMLSGSVSGAARLLHVSQPGVSRMLAHIEQQLGVELFDRGKGRWQARPEAQALFEEVERVYHGVNRIETCARNLRQGAGVRLRVLASPSVALQVVPQAVATVMTTYPALQLYLESQLVREISAQLVRQEADLAISTLPIEHGLLRSEEVGQWSLVCAFARQHRLAERATVRLGDLASERLIAFSADTPQGQLLASLWPQSSDRDAAAPRIEVRSGQMACALVASGAGVAIVDDLTARAWRSERLAFAPLRGAPRLRIYAVHHEDRPLAAAGSALVRAVRDTLKALRS